MQRAAQSNNYMYTVGEIHIPNSYLAPALGLRAYLNCCCESQCLQEEKCLLDKCETGYRPGLLMASLLLDFCFSHSNLNMTHLDKHFLTLDVVLDGR